MGKGLLGLGLCVFSPDRRGEMGGWRGGKRGFHMPRLCVGRVCEERCVGFRRMMIELLRAASCRSNHIRAKGAAALAGALGSMTALQTLNLR